MSGNLETVDTVRERERELYSKREEYSLLNTREEIKGGNLSKISFINSVKSGR